MEIVEVPHFRYKDWPGKTTLYTEKNGSATLENSHDGSILFFRSSGWEYEHNACYTYDEALELFRVLGLKIQEMADLRNRYGTDDVPDTSDFHQWLGECPICHHCHKTYTEVVELNRQVTTQ